jgi:Nuclease-related domain.
VSDVDSGLEPDNGNNTSPIWVSERPSRQAAPEDKSRPEPTYAPLMRVSARDLIEDPRYRHLRRRVIISVLVGVGVGVLLIDWRLGVTAAIIAAIADTVYQAQLVSSVPAWRRPSVAERQTEGQLRKLERSGYRSLHARAIPGTDAQIDHLVIGPTGVYAVDSEKWDKRLPVRVQSHRKLYHGPFDKKERLDEARMEASEASRLISQALGREIHVVPSLAIYGPKIPWKILNVRGVDVFDGSRVRKWITRRERALTDAEIEKIYEVGASVLPARYPEN